MGWVAHVSPWYRLLGFFFFLRAVLHVSSVRGRTCAGSQMTSWSDEDLIHEEADSPPRVFHCSSGVQVLPGERDKMIKKNSRPGHNECFSSDKKVNCLSAGENASLYALGICKEEDDMH